MATSFGGLSLGARDDAYTGVGTVGAPTAPTGAPKVPTGPAQVQTFAGYTPDYEALIKSDPSYLAGQTAAAANQSTAAAQRKAALRNAIVRYGGALPPGFADQYGDIDADTLAAASGNKQSTLANLADNYQQSEQQFLRQLASRGALQSGDLNYGEDQLQKGYAQQQYDAGNAFSDTATGALGAYTGVLSQNARDLASSVGTAESNVFANPSYRPQPASFADYASAESAQYGVPLYKDQNGVLYGADGNIYGGGNGGSGAAPAPTAPSNTGTSPVPPGQPGFVPYNDVTGQGGYGVDPGFSIDQYAPAPAPAFTPTPYAPRGGKAVAF